MRNAEPWLGCAILGTKQLCFARPGHTQDGACDPEKWSNQPGRATHGMRARNKSYFDQAASQIDFRI